MKIVDRWFEDNLSTYVRCVGKDVERADEWGAITNGTQIYRIAERVASTSLAGEKSVVLRLEGVTFLSLGEYTGLATRPEWDAVDRALEQWAKDGVITERCPNCGKLLRYVGRGTSYEVSCPTPGCLYEGFRGI